MERLFSFLPLRRPFCGCLFGDRPFCPKDRVMTPQWAYRGSSARSLKLWTQRRAGCRNKSPRSAWKRRWKDVSWRPTTGGSPHSKEKSRSDSQTSRIMIRRTYCQDREFRRSQAIISRYTSSQTHIIESWQLRSIGLRLNRHSGGTKFGREESTIHES